MVFPLCPLVPVAWAEYLPDAGGEAHTTEAVIASTLSLISTLDLGCIAAPMSALCTREVGSSTY